jgi:hypothetical protein
MKENPIPVHFQKNPQKKCRELENRKRTSGVGAVIWLAEIFENRGESWDGNRVFVDETLAKLSLNKVCLLYTQWPFHSFNMNNEYCMIIWS